LTDHCIEQYVARVKPGLKLEAAKRELIALVKLAGDPVPELDYAHENGMFLEITDGIALALDRFSPSKQRWMAITVLTRGGHNEVVTTERRARKRRRREIKRREREAKLRASGRYKTARAKQQTYGVGWPE
jgi:hypothetical protein